MTDRHTGDEWSREKILSSGLSAVLTISCILRPLIQFDPRVVVNHAWSPNTAIILSILMIPLAAYPIYYTLLPFSNRGISLLFLCFYEILAILIFSFYISITKKMDYGKMMVGIAWIFFHVIVGFLSYWDTTLIDEQPETSRPYATTEGVTSNTADLGLLASPLPTY